jgi:3-hydroxybutyryl-CoA dehydratase
VARDRSLIGCDLDSLSEGQRFASRGRTVTEADVVAFSSLTGDWHPQHADAVWAAESAFGERIAHGMLVLSFALGLVDLDPDFVQALRRVASATFKRPVRIGDTIRVEGSIVRTRPLDAATGLVDVRCRVLNQSDAAVALLVVELVWRRAAARAVGEPATAAGGRDLR